MIETLRERYSDCFGACPKDAPAPTVPERPQPVPAPCLAGAPFQCPDGKIHRILPGKNSIRGPICDTIGTEIEQLPAYGTGIRECPLVREQRLKGTPVEGFKLGGEIKNAE
jgi:hypothetical protein